MNVIYQLLNKIVIKSLFFLIRFKATNIFSNYFSFIHVIK